MAIPKFVEKNATIIIHFESYEKKFKSHSKLVTKKDVWHTLIPPWLAVAGKAGQLKTPHTFSVFLLLQMCNFTLRGILHYEANNMLQ